MAPLEAGEGGVPILLGEGRESKDAPVSLRMGLIQAEPRGLGPGLMLTCLWGGCDSVCVGVLQASLPRPCNPLPFLFYPRL